MVVVHVFVGCPEDARDLARQVSAAQPRLQELASEARTWTGTEITVDVDYWGNQMSGLPIGQENITPKLERADFGVFVFKRRTGSTTPEELRDLQSRGVWITALFPEHPSDGTDMQSDETIDDWKKLVEYRRSLSQPWSGRGTKAIETRMYGSEQDIVDAVLEDFESFLKTLVQRGKTTRTARRTLPRWYIASAAVLLAVLWPSWWMSRRDEVHLILLGDRVPQGAPLTYLVRDGGDQIHERDFRAEVDGTTLLPDQVLVDQVNDCDSCLLVELQGPGLGTGVHRVAIFYRGEQCAANEVQVVPR